MRVLVACEESQAVCIAFRERGHEAFSCDIIPCSGGHPEWHIQDDVLNVIKLGWDIMIAHPPCTHLAVSGAAWFKNKQKQQAEAIEFFARLLFCTIERICVENPVCIISSVIKQPTQIIQPYDFGDPFQKTTCLWLKNLPQLVPTKNELPLFGEYIDKGEFIKYKSGKTMPKWYAESWGNGKKRSKTFPGIANAMAEQWGKL